MAYSKQLYGNTFKSKTTHNDRRIESMRIFHKYPERVPTLVEKSTHCNDLINIDKNKYLVPQDITMSQFLFIIRKRLKLPPEKALFLFVNDTIASGNQTMGSVYNEHKDGDGFLYIEYSSENTFG
jgi:GABA(A) receptor-associated protein